ncbi:MAG: hypothetical protein ACREJO_00245 [Phycisphaerales bacterium]
MHPRTRVVHLLDPAICGAEGVLACGSCLTMSSVEQHVWLIGGTEDAKLTHSLGVPAADRVAMAAGLTETAAWNLRALARSRLNEADVADTVIQCWSLAGLGLARLAFGDRHRRTALFVHGPDAGWRTALGRRRRRFAMKGATALAMTEELAIAWRAADVKITGTVDIPPLSTPWLAGDREAVRAELRVRPDEIAVLMLADPPGAGDARDAVALLGMMRFAGPRLVGLFDRRATGFARAARFNQRFGRHWDMIAFRGSPLHAMAAADVVLWDSHQTRSRQRTGMVAGGAILAQAACTAGIPVVAARDPLTERVLGASANASLADDNLMPALGKRLMPLLESGAARAELGEALAAATTTSVASSRFHQQMLGAWGIEAAVLGAAA